MATIELRGVSKVFPNGVRAVDDVALDVADGEILTLVGPSGCGKSTLLRLLAGLEEVTTGTVSIGGRDVTSLGPGVRDVAMVFQHAAVFPHLDVGDNIGFGLRLRRRPRAEVQAQVAEVAALLHLDGLLDRRPSQLSGGQRQRVAIGRALLRRPTVSLMDEPLSSLDARLRAQMRAEIGRLQRQAGITTIYVTHDQAEALLLADRVAVMRDGRLEQVDTPQAVYARPATAFVAAFVGSPAMNLLEGRCADGMVEVEGRRLPLRAPLPDGTPVLLGIRPCDLVATEEAAPDGRVVLDVVVEVVEQLGAETHLRFALGAAHRVDTDDGDPLLTAVVPPGSAVHPGARVRLTADPERVHLFDATSGAALTGSV